MARQIEKLSSLFVARASEPGWYGDGGNLWLQVTPSGSKSWLFRYKTAGKTKVVGLGATHTVSLAEARKKARAMRQQLLDFIDPAAARLKRKAAARNVITFEEAASKYIESKRSGWKSQKHAEQWTNTLKTYCGPINGRSVAEIQIADVMECLEPIWKTKSETASRVRQRMERVLDWAKTAGYRSGDNPAAWKGVLDNLLASPAKVVKKTHHPSLPYSQAPAFMRDLRTHSGISALALEFLILTATRSGEVRMATWDEIDGNTWTIPAERMKAGREHQVPLSKQAMAVLAKVPRLAGNNYIFPSSQEGKCISDMSMTALLRGMKVKTEKSTETGWTDKEGKTIVAHGFRSTFRMWVAEQTNYVREVAEHALAHKLPDKVEAAYQRETVLPKRILLMQDWANFLD